MKTELKPCPFCGGKAEQHRFGIDKVVFFKCEKCSAMVSFVNEHDTDLTIMTEAWNRRANDCDSGVNFGQWIPDDYEYYHCSECGYEMDEREYITPYCPNCGAKIDLDNGENSENNDKQRSNSPA